jgi:hypothetical protein
MITRDPRLIWNPLPEATTQPFIIPCLWIIHTAVDGRGPTDLGNYFDNAGINLESHTWLRWASHEQFIPFTRSADANFKANRFLIGGKWYGAISTETEDDGDPVRKPWNAYQSKELIRFGADTICKGMGIKADKPRTWNGNGIGYHSLFPMVWTNVAGKTCPGSTRIDQLNDEILPGIRKRLVSAPINKGDDMEIRIQTFVGGADLPVGQKGVGAKYKVSSGKDKGGQRFDFEAIHLDEKEYKALKYIQMDEVAGSIIVTADVKRVCTFVGGPFNTI